MSLGQRRLPPVPEDTIRVAKAAFPRGNVYVLLRDRLGAVFADDGFADLYPRRGHPAYSHGASPLSPSCSSARG